MIFGATVAGMTSEGGGAVAFPVMTLALGIAPSVARDFSLMIQGCMSEEVQCTNEWKLNATDSYTHLKFTHNIWKSPIRIASNPV